jgi:hypothetical protein
MHESIYAPDIAKRASKRRAAVRDANDGIDDAIAYLADVVSGVEDGVLTHDERRDVIENLIEHGKLETSAPGPLSIEHRS